MPVSGIPTEVLLAFDSFKGTLSSGEVAESVGRGLRAAGWDCASVPVADGGEGTLAVLAPALGLELVPVTVSDPLGRPAQAHYGSAGELALVEMAAASGLGRVADAERDPVAASTSGTGELIAAAVADGARTVYVGVGGSATTDGGAGAVEAISRAGGLRAARVVVLCDVRTAFEDAARVYGPQKGASPEQVQELEARLDQLARRWPRDPRGRPMTGAAGGLSGGLWAALGAELVSGSRFVLDLLGFDVRMLAARAVVTGEGQLDRQSLEDKLVGEVATRCRQAGVPCHAVVGRRALDAFDQRILDLQVVLEAGTPAALEAAGLELGRLL